MSILQANRKRDREQREIGESGTGVGFAESDISDTSDKKVVGGQWSVVSEDTQKQ